MPDSRTVRRQFQVDQGGLNSPVAQPPAQVVQRDSVERHMPGKTMPQRVGPDIPTLGDLANLSGLSITGWSRATPALVSENTSLGIVPPPVSSGTGGGCCPNHHPPLRVLITLPSRGVG